MKRNVHQPVAVSALDFLEMRKFEQLGRLLPGIVHNLGSSLTAVKGYSEMLVMEHGEIEELGAILEEARVIERIVDLYKRLCLNLEERREEIIQLNAILRLDLEALEADMFFKHKVKRRLLLDENLPSFTGVSADIGSALLELLNNAIEAMALRSDPLLTVRTRQDSVYQIVEIMDNGCGIPASDLERVFDFFYTTKNPQGGETGKMHIGLGLGLARHLIEGCGGRITLSSKAGEGTRAELRLPLTT